MMIATKYYTNKTREKFSMMIATKQYTNKTEILHDDSYKISYNLSSIITLVNYYASTWIGNKLVKPVLRGHIWYKEKLAF